MVRFGLGLFGLLFGFVSGINTDELPSPALSERKVITSVYTKTFTAFSASDASRSGADGPSQDWSTFDWSTIDWSTIDYSSVTTSQVTDAISTYESTYTYIMTIADSSPISAPASSRSPVPTLSLVTSLGSGAIPIPAPASVISLGTSATPSPIPTPTSTLISLAPAPGSGTGTGVTDSSPIPTSVSSLSAAPVLSSAISLGVGATPSPIPAPAPSLVTSGTPFPIPAPVSSLSPAPAWSSVTSLGIGATPSPIPTPASSPFSLAPVPGSGTGITDSSPTPAPASSLSPVSVPSLVTSLGNGATHSPIPAPMSTPSLAPVPSFGNSAIPAPTLSHVASAAPAPKTPVSLPSVQSLGAPPTATAISWPFSSGFVTVVTSSGLATTLTAMASPSGPIGVTTVTITIDGILTTEIVPAAGFSAIGHSPSASATKTPSNPIGITTFGASETGSATSLTLGACFTSSGDIPAFWTFTMADGSTVVNCFPPQTSTITSLPNIQTEHTTNSLWVSNTVTTISGTVLPVVDVDPKTHNGTIIFGLPYPPPWNTVISLPGLPPMSWPCVPIPFIISCPGPPTPPGPPPPPPPPDVPPMTYGGNNPGSEPGETPTSSTTASPTSSESSSSSSSSGCTSATSFGRRSTPTEAPACLILDSTWDEYMIVPTYGLNNYGAQQAFTTTLNQTLGANFTYILELDSQNTVYYWIASMNSTQLQLFTSDPMVNYITPTSLLNSITWNYGNGSADSTSSFQKRDLSWSWSNDNDQLYYISQARNVSEPEGYFFDESQGLGSTIYIVDTGCDPNHAEFARQDLHNASNWIFPQGLGTTFVNGIEVPWVTTDLTDPDGHGTRMAAMAAGVDLGVAPHAQLVIVKNLSQPKAVQGFKIYEWMMAALRDILQDINVRGSGTYSVIQQALILTARPGNAWFFTPGSPYYLLYQDLFASGVTVVTGAGNSALKGTPELNAYPALLGITTDWPIIIVGGVNSDGSIWPQTQGLQSGRIDVLALSSYVSSALANSDPNAEVLTNGTSDSSAAVSGLVAYFLGLETTMAQRAGGPGSFSGWMRNYVKSLAYPRIAGGVPVIYNGAPANALDLICAHNMDNNTGSEKEEAPSCSVCVCTSEPTTTPTPTSSIVPSVQRTTTTASSSSDSVVVIVPTTLSSSSYSTVEIVPISTPQPALPTSSGFWVAGLEGTLSDLSSYSQIISGPNQHIQCGDIGTAVVFTMNQATPQYVIDAYIVGVANGANGATAAELAVTKNAILLQSQECSSGDTCFKLCNGADPELEIAANNGDRSTPVSFMDDNQKTSLGECTFLNQVQENCIIGNDDDISRFTITYLWDCVGNDPSFCAGEF